MAEASGGARTAVVTGANRGIGEAVAAELRERGLRVVPTSREPRQGFVTLDVTRADQVAALARQLAGEGGIDVLVNNAGTSLDGFDEGVVRRTLDANFLGAMRVTDALLPLVRPGGRIVMVSSGLGSLTGVRGDLRARFEDPGLTREALVALVEEFPRDVAAGVHERRGWPSNAYRVSKIAMNALVRVMARELAGDPRRILVNAADPGWVRTRMGGRSAPRSVEHGARTPVWLALLPEGGPTGGFFRDEHAVAF
ncbi:MAG TPA: SDR family NAD(P)-dependent oxidoreductase [Polyangiaceae bacterium]